MSNVENTVRPGALVEPSAGERANGWTAESLTTYLQQRERERARGLAGLAGAASGAAVPCCDGRYDPWSW